MEKPALIAQKVVGETLEKAVTRMVEMDAVLLILSLAVRMFPKVLYIPKKM